jgi:hypothetical protein
MSRPRRSQTRWAYATLITLAVHGLVFLGLSRTPSRGPPAEPPIVEITLAAPETRRTPPPPTTRSAERSRAAPLQLHQPPSLTGPVQGSGFQVGTPTPGPAPNVPGPPQAVAPAAPALKLDCLNLSPAARRSVYGRVDCQPQRYAKLKGADDSVTDIPANAAWDAQIARQMQKHNPLPPPQPQLGNCDNQNLGFGCTGEALIPLVKRKF